MAVALAEDIADLIERRILSRRIPSIYLWGIRDLSRRLKVNMKTVARAYQILSERNLVEHVVGIGTRVKFPTQTVTSKRQKTIVMRIAERLVETCVDFNVVFPDLDEMAKRYSARNQRNPRSKEEVTL